MKLIIGLIIILIVIILYACIVAGARADEQSQRMFEEWEQQKFEKD